jgi:alpha-tubulin suppressor-like RCC1 family protein
MNFLLQFVVIYFYLISENKVFSWGKNEFGKLGHGDTKDRNTPTQVNFFDGKKMIQISCGYCHCLALEGDQNQVN